MMPSKRSLIVALFFLAFSITTQANWSQEIIQTGNVQFLDFSVQDNPDPFAIKVEKPMTPREVEQVVVFPSPSNGIDPIAAWAQSYGQQTMSRGFANYYPILIYYPVPIYYPIYYRVYTPYYFN
jgi:hypothetical protein